MNLPVQAGLPVHLLAVCFNYTAATYKFYWFLSILHQVELGKTVIEKRDLFAGMVAQAWFTVNYFHVSFGKQDQLQQAIERIKLMDKSIHGYKKRMKENPEQTKPLLKEIIKNTYRTLMSRGMKGCYVYFVDKETEDYFQNSI